VELIAAGSGARVAEVGPHYLQAGSRRLATLRPDELDGTYELVVAWPDNPLGSGEFFWRVSIYPWLPDPASAACHLQASRLCRFTCVSFPDRGWRRPVIVEPESEVELVEVEASAQTGLRAPEEQTAA
jgi:hypothetical protein